MQNNSINSQTDIANVTVVTEENQIIVPQPITSVIEVNNPGPQGPVGPQGVAGPSEPFVNIGGGVYATTSSIQVSGSFLVSGSSTFTNIGPAIFSGSANIVGATTMSSAIVTGNVTVLGTASIGTLVVNQTVLSTGSNQLGDNANDIQTLYGSVIVPTGSLTVSGSAIISSSANTQLQVGSNLFFVSRSGNVGIGTATPLRSLDVRGTARIENGGSCEFDIIGQVNNFRIGVSSTQALVGTLNNFPLTFYTNASERMRIDTTGSVGIGITSPSENLHVSGNILIGQYAGSTSLLRFANLTNAGNSAYIGQTAAAGFEIQPGSVNEFRINTPAGTDTAALTIFGNGVRTAQFYRNSRSRFGGNLSTNPGSTVEIIGGGATGATIALTVQNSSATPLLRVINDASILFGGASVGLFPSTNKGQSVNSGAGGLFIGYAASGDLSYPEIPSVTIGRPNDRLLNSTSGTTIMGSVVGNYSPTSGTGAFTTLEVVPTINQTGGANGITRGLYINPTLTSAANWRAIEVASGASILNGVVAINSTNISTGYALFVNGVIGASSLTLTQNLTMGENFAISNNGSQTIDIDANNNTTDAVFRVTANGTANELFRVNELGNFGIGTIAPSYTLDVSGSGGSTARFKGSAGQSTVSLNDGTNDNYIVGLSGRLQLRPSGNTTFTALATGEIGIGTITPTYKLDVSGSVRMNGTLNMSGSLTDFNLIDYSGSLYGTRIRLRDFAWNGGSGVTLDSNNIFLSTAGDFRTAGGYALITNTATAIGGNYPSLTTRFTVQGQGTTSATKTVTIMNNTSIDTLNMWDNGQVAFTSPTMSLAVSQSAFRISPIISASNIVGGQYYGVSITPTFFQTTGSQTETAFRVAATFTQSSAVATSGTNIIADFGSTSAGSQLTVTDVTSGSIYMVNDVSGIPIIEATSNWDVNMYDFPNKVFEKTGSQVNIYGTMRVSGSFILPLSQSVAPQTGSAYWSGSLLFIYNGTRYMSSSFA